MAAKDYYRIILSASAAALTAAVLLLARPVAFAGEAEPAEPLLEQPVVIDFFYEAGCPDCLRVRQRILPELSDRFRGYYVLNGHDVLESSNAVKLLAYETSLGAAFDEPVSMVVDYRSVLSGFENIRTGLFDCVDAGITRRIEPGWTPPTPIPCGHDAAGKSGLLSDKMRGFRLALVLVAGLTDGFNPCAIATLVFLMSLLAVSRIAGRKLLLVGFVFCLASFVTYLAIGLGILKGLYLLDAYPRIRTGIELAVIAALFPLSFLSFRDAWRYSRQGDAKAVSLKLPHPLRMAINRMSHRLLHTGALACGSFVLGAAVTALEGVCTGQTYVPTLVAVIKGGPQSGVELSRLAGRAWLLLLLYNVMFIVPLVVVFLLSYRGVASGRLVEWSRKNVVPAKVAMGALFLLMALLMAVLAARRLMPS